MIASSIFTTGLFIIEFLVLTFEHSGDNCSGVFQLQCVVFVCSLDGSEYCKCSGSWSSTGSEFLQNQSSVWKLIKLRIKVTENFSHLEEVNVLISKIGNLGDLSSDIYEFSLLASDCVTAVLAGLQRSYHAANNCKSFTWFRWVCSCVCFSDWRHAAVQRSGSCPLPDHDKITDHSWHRCCPPN